MQAYHCTSTPPNVMKTIKESLQFLFMWLCSQIADVLFTKWTVVIAVILVSHGAAWFHGALRGHVVAQKTVATVNECFDSGNKELDKVATAFRIESPVEQADMQQEFVPRAVLVDGILTETGDEQYFLNDGSVLPPPEGSDPHSMQVNLPVYNGRID